ncbi:MAG: CoA pyrophosphatase [Anaerolineae bacterium]
MITLDDVRAALALTEFDVSAAQLHMAPGTRGFFPKPDAPPREAGVLVLLYPGDSGLCVLLTRRTKNIRDHSGQISFPGGKRDPHDESFTATALREACEELGICDEPMTILGELTTIYIPPSNFEVHPTVAAMNSVPHITANPREVEEVFALPLRDLLDHSIKRTETRDFNGYKVEIPYYAVNGQQVWGATAIMLSEFEHRLRAVVGMG